MSLTSQLRSKCESKMVWNACILSLGQCDQLNQKNVTVTVTLNSETLAETALNRRQAMKKVVVHIITYVTVEDRYVILIRLVLLKRFILNAHIELKIIIFLEIITARLLSSYIKWISTRNMISSVHLCYLTTLYG